MPRVSKLIHSFNGGEVTPEFAGRTDQDKYSTSAARIENFIVHPEGSLHRRPGTRFAKDSTYSDKRSRLVPFIFSTVQAYILEFSEFRIRVFADDVQLLAPIQSTGTGVVVLAILDQVEIQDHGYNDGQGPIHITATAGIPGGLALNTDYWIVLPTTTVFTDSDVDTATEIITAPSDHGYSTSQGPFQLTTTGALPEGLSANVDYFVERVSATEIKLRLTPTGGTVLIGPGLRLGTHSLSPTGNNKRDLFKLSATEGGPAIDITTDGTSPHTFTPNPLGTPPGLVLEIVTPYTDSEIFDLHFVQSADFLFIDHQNHRPSQLTRLGNTKWSLDFSSQFDGPYLAENSDDTALMDPSASSFPNTDITMTLTGPILIHEGAGWQTGDIGRLVRWKQGGNDWGHVEITGIHETGSGVNTVARATIRSKLANTTASGAWRLGSWYPSNWPRTLSFSDQRLWHAGEPNTPQTLHGSETALFTDFSPTEEDGVVLDTNAINFQIGANQVNAILWLGTERQLFAGTPASVFVARASLDSEAITPDNINLPQMTAIGSTSIQPINISNNLLYLTRNHQSLRGIQFVSDSGAFSPVDLNLLAKHIFGRTLTITTMAFQFDRQQVLWLTRSDGVLIALTYVPDQQVFAWHRHIIGGSFGSGGAVVESVAVIPSLDGSYDQLWMVVKRTVNGNTVRHIEFLEDEWLDGVGTNMRFVDSAPASYSGSPVSTISGIEHLEGETVQVISDGAVHPDRIVSSGSITLDALYSNVTVGLKYISEIETLKLDLPDPEGSSMGKVARIDHLVLRFFETLGGKVGSSVSKLDPLIFRRSDNPMDSAAPFFTGDKKIAFRGGFVREKVIVVRQDQPLPMNLLAINTLGSTSPR